MNQKTKLILVFGLPGSGKSFLAEKIAGLIGAVYISSDIVRKVLIKDRTYSSKEKQVVYAHMLNQAKEHLVKNEQVVVDATFVKSLWRDRFIELAITCDADYYFLNVIANEKDIEKRLSIKRKHSEATFQVYQELKKTFDDISTKHLVLDSSELSIETMIFRTLEYTDLN